MVEVRGSTMALAGVTLLVAIIAQVTMIGPLALPLGPPDVVLILLACIALGTGPSAGALLGFGSGLVADLLSAHVLGQLALVFCLVGYVVGLLAAGAAGSIALSLAAVAGASAAGTAGYAATSAILGDPALAARQVVPHALVAAGYSLVATPFLYPMVAIGLRRAQEGRR
jgi:rod shape-determining protein MreD